MAIVTFDPAAFKLTYPEFGGVDDARLMMLFDIAQYTILDNVDNAPPMDLSFRTQLFNLAVAHLLLIFGTDTTARPDGTVDNTPPGRITSATEGTVSTSFQLEVTNQNGSAPWWNQTKYGAMYWMATARFRSFKYAANGGSGIGFARAYGQPPFFVPGGV